MANVRGQNKLLRDHFTRTGKPKKAYVSQAYANLAAIEQCRNGRIYEGYECDVCAKFHIGEKK